MNIEEAMSALHGDNPTPTGEAMACCAHRKVVYKRIEHEGGTCSDSWLCADCETRFWPNAALAAEREKQRGIINDWQDFGTQLSKHLDGVTTDEWLESAQQLREQLAAAEQGQVCDAVSLMDENKQLREQLDEEKLEHQQASDALEAHMLNAAKLKNQLDAAVEALRQIATVEAQDEDETVAGFNQTQSYEIARAALARIGGDAMKKLASGEF